MSTIHDDPTITPETIEQRVDCLNAEIRSVARLAGTIGLRVLVHAAGKLVVDPQKAAALPARSDKKKK